MIKYLIAAAGISALLPVHAAVTVSDVFGSGTSTNSKLHYLLNETAASGTLTVATSAAPGTPIMTHTLTAAELAKGAHDYAPTLLPPGQYVFKVSVTAAAHTAYDAITPVTPLPSGATISYAARFNKHTGTLTYGHAIMADFSLNAAYEVNSAGGLVKSIPAPTIDATGFVPVGANWDDSGVLYLSSQNFDDIYRFTPTGTPVAPIYPADPDAVYTGPVADDTSTPPSGTLFTRAFQLFGSGDTATVYTTDYNTQALEQTVLNDTADPPTQLFTTIGTLAPNRLDMLLVTPDQKTIYVSDGGEAAGTLPHVNKWILGQDTSGTPTWMLDPSFAENNVGSAKLLSRARGLAFTPDMQFLYVTQNGGASSDPSTNYIAKVSLARGSASDPTDVTRVLKIAGGLTESTPDDVTALDKNGDGVITLADAFGFVGLSGGITLKIPTPSGASLPVTCDTDAKGNLLVVAKADPTGSGTSGDVYFILAPPDSGSQDNYTSPAFTVI